MVPPRTREEREIADRFLDLSEGRVCYRVYGDQSLKNPVLYFHGLPGSRLEAAIADTEAGKLGISLIAADRPGMGGSGYFRRRTPHCWAPIAAALARALGTESLKIFAVSGGTPYALAVAHDFPQLVESGIIVSGVAPYPDFESSRGMMMSNRLLLELARRIPAAGRLQTGAIAKLLRRVPAAGPLMIARSSRADRRTLRNPAVFNLMRENALESVRRDIRGVQDEVQILAGGWRSAPDVAAPFRIYHGDDDRIVPVAAAHTLQGALPRSRLEIIPGEGHMLIIDRYPEMLRELAADRTY